MRNSLSKIECLFVEILKGRKFYFLKPFLYPISLLFYLFLQIRNHLYKFNVLKKEVFDLPVVCIGNIKAGGTGKTPFAIYLASDLIGDLKMTLVSTGYKALGVTKDLILSTIDQKGREVPALFCGDEPYLIKKNIPMLEVYISKNRKACIDKASKNRSDLVLLEDGFQQKNIHKDLTVLMIDPKDPLGKSGYLPYGFLRDTVSEMQNASYFCMQVESFHQINIKKIVLELKKVSSAPVFITKRIPYYFKGEQNFPLKQIRGKSIIAFCGIANPDTFFDLLRSIGAEIILSKVLADHQRVKQFELEKIIKEAGLKSVDYIVCTEKDYVKLDFLKCLGIPILYLQTKLEIIYGKKEYENLKKRIKALVETKSLLKRESLNAKRNRNSTAKTWREHFKCDCS